MAYVLQSESETIAWVFEFAEFIKDGDSLIGSGSVTATDGVSVDSTVLLGTTVTATLSGFTHGIVSRVKCQVATSQGELLSKTAAIRAGDR